MNTLVNDRMSKKAPIAIWRIILAILNYFVGYMMIYPLLLVKITRYLDPNAIMVPQFYRFVVYFMMIVITVILVWPIFKESYYYLRRQNFIDLLKMIAKLYFIMLVASIFVNMIVSFLSNSPNSANQVEVESSLASESVLMIFTTLIFAPIVEEGVFRGAIFRPLRSKYNFYFSAFLSSLMFGFIHISQSLMQGNYQDLWFLITYTFIGMFTCHAYEKTGSIYASMLFHFINNLLAVLVLL